MLQVQSIKSFSFKFIKTTFHQEQELINNNVYQMPFCMSSSFLSYEKKEKRMYVYFPSIDEKINLMQCVFKQETDKFFPLTGIKKKRAIPTTDKIDICSSNKEQKKCSCTNIYESAWCK